MSEMENGVAVLGDERGSSTCDTLRTRVRAQMESDSLSTKAASQQAGLGYSTLSAWMNGNYNGNNEDVEIKLSRWLESCRTSTMVRRAMPKEPEFLETPSSQIWMSVFEYAQAGPDIGLITGNAGVGKTMSAEEYKKNTPNVWMMTADSSMRSPTAILRELTEILDANEKRGPRMMASVIQRVRGTRGLLIVDEAQNLTTEAIDLLRTIFDRGQIGLVFMGNEPLRGRIEGMGRQTTHAQIFSRVGMRKNRAKPQVKDILQVLDAWGIVDSNLRKICRWIAMQPGGLRTLNKTLRYAFMLVGASGRDVLAEDDLKVSWKELTGMELPSFAGRE
ncbi:hypothetical protein HK16_10785 [Acetobacter senegalensis]|uniref:DNA transposition protein n=2 Tax=Acetobacter TaxID=434 RepID=A0A252EJC3_9PROT|nr:MULTISPECIES: AAA family ATPase [Acetobacter]ATJ89396.1 hypothetical protein CIW82_00360 [Acetobacter tropicalis]OUL66353.1 hypothetical protein HK16_10785 [Acetobacter senegalensis]